jgi:hypothetical protein
MKLFVIVTQRRIKSACFKLKLESHYFKLGLQPKEARNRDSEEQVTLDATFVFF